LVIQIGEVDILAVVEIKVGSSFSPEQLQRYRRELKRMQRTFGFKEGILITLTDRDEQP